MAAFTEGGDVTEVCAVLLARIYVAPSVAALPKVQTALEGSREVGEDRLVHFCCIPGGCPGTIT